MASGRPDLYEFVSSPILFSWLTSVSFGASDRLAPMNFKANRAISMEYQVPWWTPQSSVKTWLLWAELTELRTELLADQIYSDLSSYYGWD